MYSSGGASSTTSSSSSTKTAFFSISNLVNGLRQHQQQLQEEKGENGTSSKTEITQKCMLILSFVYSVITYGVLALIAYNQKVYLISKWLRRKI